MKIRKRSKRTFVERMFAGILALFMVLTTCPDAYRVVRAANTYKIHGRITNEAGNGLPSLNIVLHEQGTDSQNDKTTYTNSGGFYEFLNLDEKKNYDVKIDSTMYVGYQTTIYLEKDEEWSTSVTKNGTGGDLTDQTIAWENESNLPDDINCLSKATFAISGMQGNCEVVYELKDMDSNGIISYSGNDVTFLKAGDYTLVAYSRAMDGYKESNHLEHDITVKRIDRGVKLTQEKAEPSRTNYPGTIQLSAKPDKGTYTVMYRMKSGDATIDGNVVTPTGTGDMVAEAYIEETDVYTEVVKPINFHVDKGVNAFVKDPDKVEKTQLAYGGEDYDIPWETATGITYGVSEEDSKYISVSEAGKVHVKTASKEQPVTVTVQMKAVHDDNYDDIDDKSIEIEIVRADQTVSITNGNTSIEYKKGLSYTFKTETKPAAASSETDNKLKIELVEDINGIVINPMDTSGTFKFSKAGTIKVKATRSGNDHYADAESEVVSLKVSSLSQVISFSEVAGEIPVLEILVGRDSVFDGLPLVKTGDGTGAITYEIEGNEKVSVDSTTGTIRLIGLPRADKDGLIGKYLITATKAKDDVYDEAEASYYVKLSYMTTNQILYTIETVRGERKENGWYWCEEVDIYPVSPLYVLREAGTGAPLDRFPIIKDGTYEAEFFVEDKLTGIKYPYIVPINKDNADPYINRILINSTELVGETGETWGDKNITFLKAPAGLENQVVVRFGDDVAYPDYPKIQYFVDYNAMGIRDDVAVWNGIADDWTNQDSKQVQDDSHFVLYVRVTDAAGHVSYKHTNLIAYDTVAPSVKATIANDGGKEGDVFMGDVTLNLDVTDDSSRLKKVYYTVTYRDLTSDTFKTSEEIPIYENGLPNPAYSDLYATLPNDKKQLVITKDKFNYNDMIVTVYALDFAGRSNHVEVKFGIDATKPSVNYSFKGNPSGKMPGNPYGKQYFDESVTLQIKISGKQFAFSREGVYITINDTTIAGEKLQNYFTDNNDARKFHVIKQYATQGTKEQVLWGDRAWIWNGEWGNEALFTAEIEFTGSTEYKVSIKYRDAYNRPGFDNNADTKDLQEFVVDKDAPDTTISYVDPSDPARTSIEKSTSLLDEVKFKVLRKDATSFYIEAKDDTTPIKEVYYYKVSGEAAKNALKEEKLQEVKDWIPLTGVSSSNGKEWTSKASDDIVVSEDEKYVIYVKVVDYVDNVSYFSNCGVVVDTSPSVVELSFDGPNDWGYYKNNLPITVTVTEPEVNNAFSGLAKLEYVVANDLTQTEINNVLAAIATKGDLKKQVETVLGDNSQKITQYDNKPYSDAFVKTDTYEFTITANDNNSDFVYVFVRATDKAGNVKVFNDGYVTVEYKNEKISGPMKFSVSKPEINVEFKEDVIPTNTVADKEGNERDYYQKPIVVYLYVTGRESVLSKENLQAGLCVYTWSATDVKKTKRTFTITEAEDYKYSDNAKDLDQAVRKFQIVFNEQANYDFSISYVDKAGNSITYEEVKFDGLKRTDKLVKDGVQYFTMDNKKPSGKVTVDGYTWTQLLGVLTFGLWKPGEITWNANAKDATSPVIIKYYLTDKTSALTATQLNKLYAEDEKRDDKDRQWKTYRTGTELIKLKSEEDETITEDQLGWFLEEPEMVLDPSKRFTLYARIQDYAGNYVYVSSDGYVLDSEAVSKDNIIIKLDETSIKLKPEGAVGETKEIGVYNKDVGAMIRVSEIDANKTDEELAKLAEKRVYSGLQKVEYWVVTNEGTTYKKETQRDTLFEYKYKRNDSVNSNDGELQVLINGEAQEIERYENDPTNTPLYKHLYHTFETNVTIDSTLNNCSDVTLHVGVWDNAGNYEEKTVKLDIDVTKPAIKVTFDQNDAHKIYTEPDTGHKRGYFPIDRTATIVITERSNHFNPEDASNNILLEAVDVFKQEIIFQDEYGKELGKYDLNALKDSSKWVTEKKVVDGVPIPDQDTHMLVIPFKVDANYDFTISYTDLANNSNEGVSYFDEESEQESVTPNYFTIDKVAPTGTVTAWDMKELAEEALIRVKDADVAGIDSSVSEEDIAGFPEIYTWSDLINVLTFGIWNNKRIAVTATKFDETSVMEDLVYYLAKDDKENTALNWKDLEKIPDSQWVKFDRFVLEPDKQRTVYLRITDYAGNTTYVSTNALILDGTRPEVDSLRPAFGVSPEASSDIYNGDVKINVTIVDPSVNDAFSGIKSVEYSVRSLNVETQSGSLFTDQNWAGNAIDNDAADKMKEDAAKENTEPNFFTHEKLEEIKSHSDSFTVLASKNNSNDVVVTVSITDNAGNTNSKSISLKIDVTKPTINVTYDNNDGDATFADAATDAYFKEQRTATIVVTERNFDPARFVVNVTNTDGVIPTLSGWTTNAAGGNGDGTTHVATITYAADGDYTFEASVIDQAGNANESIDFGNSMAPQKFTVDKTLPVISIAYDNNDAKNGNYYKAMRSATVTIVEHNFETSRIRVTMTATDDETPIALPQVSAWANYGDRHVAVINFSNDALYSLDVDYEDKARNASADMEPHRFYVDKTMPVLKIDGIVDESANNNNGYIGFVLTATDVNFDVFKPTIKATVRDGEGFAVKELSVGSVEDVKNGKALTVKNLEDDGIYRVECVLVDKAGNEYNEVILTKKDGKEYTERRKAGDALVTFSVNRKGSTYELDETTKALVEKYYVRNVVNDLALIEVNADPLTSRKVTVNGKELSEGSDYTVTESGGKGKWYRYTYVLKKSLFESEGEYVIVCSSKDKANNDAFNDVKGVNAKFVVDRTAPVVTVTGLSEKGRYQTESQTVTIVPTDDGGALKSVTVSLVGKDGSIIENLLKLEGEALDKMLEQGNGMLNFNVPEGLYQNVKLVVEDMAGSDEEDANTFDQTIVNVSVSPNGFLIFWANRPLRFGVIGGLAAFVALLIFLVVWKRRKEQKR